MGWAIAFLPLAAFPQESNVIANTLKDSNGVYNVKLVLTFPQSTFTNGEPIMFQAGLSNNSDSATIVMPSLLTLNLDLLVTNANGVQMVSLETDDHFFARISQELVSPHSLESSYRPIPLNKYFNLTTGTYRLCAVRYLGRYPYHMVKSEVVTITILDSPVPTASNNVAPPIK